MLAFYLPIIILNAMFDARTVVREPTDLSRPEHQDDDKS